MNTPVNWNYMMNGKADKTTFNTLKKKIGQLANRKGHHYYIGKATEGNQPTIHWQQKLSKIKDIKGNYLYKTMYVLCVTEKEIEAIQLKDWIVKYYSNKGDKVFYGSIDNETSGGGRRGKGCGYVYLVV